MRPHDLLTTAEILLSSARGRPATASLCRAISSVYYAIFHSLAYDAANLLIGATKNRRSEPAWRQVYRSLEHGHAKAKCKNGQMLKQFPQGIVDFAHAFVTMQEKRHAADYDPFFKITKSEVIADIIASEFTIHDFMQCDARSRRAFCAYVLLKDRP